MSGTKRKHDPDSPNEVFSNKSRARPSVEARVDPTYGQRSALPGLDDDLNIDEDGLDYGEDMDALSYLRAVRQEAFGIPNLLVAPKETNGREIYESGVGDHRGAYGDGAYYAAEVSEGTEDSPSSDPNLSYFDSILSRFELLRAQLQQTPPENALLKLGEDHPTHVGGLNTAAARWWRWKMRTIDPLPAQIASMDKSTVLRLLGLLSGGTLLKRGTEVEVGASRWAWCLLARLPERGELTSEEIGVVRELGKKAVLVGMGLKEDEELDGGLKEVEADFDPDLDQDDSLDNGIENKSVDIVNKESLDNDNTFEKKLAVDIAMEDAPHFTIMPDLVEVLDESSVPRSSPPPSSMPSIDTVKTSFSEEKITDAISQPDDENALAVALTAAKQRMLSTLEEGEEVGPNLSTADAAEVKNEKTAKWNTKATVDMIITVAGEVYGQRDLLEFRGAWD